MSFCLPPTHSSNHPISSQNDWLYQPEPRSDRLTHNDALPPIPSKWKSGYPDSPLSPEYGVNDSSVLPNPAIDTNHNWHTLLSPKDMLLWSYYSPHHCSISPPEKHDNINIGNMARLSNTKHNHCSGDACGRKSRHALAAKRNLNGMFFSAKSSRAVESSVDLDFDCAMLYNRAIHSPCLQLDGLRYERSMLLDTSGENKVGVLLGQVSPYSAVDGVPLPEKLLLEPGYIHRRNERERDRVRSLNEGYDRLKQRLPLRIKDKRISKVDTLRIAIRYIRQLRRILGQADATETESGEATYGLTQRNIGGRDHSDSSSEYDSQFNEINDDDSCDGDCDGDFDAEDIIVSKL